MEQTRTEAFGNVQQSHGTNDDKHMANGPAKFDCETASLLRAILLPLFAGAESWTDLIDRLEAKGYHPMFRDGQLCLTQQSDGARICGLRFLGLEMRTLVQRFGRPCVLPFSASSADGEILRHPPERGTLH